MLFSCSENKDEELIKPDRLIEATKMEGILKDIQYAEDASKELNISYKELRPTLNRFYKQVFEIHEISQQDFDSSYTFYLKHPAILSGMYEQILTNMQMDEIQMKKAFKEYHIKKKQRKNQSKKNKK